MSTSTIKAFNITNPSTGADLGTYAATSQDAALDRMAQEAGYEDYAACCKVAGDEPLRVTETTEWFPYAQGYRRAVGGELAEIGPDLGSRWAWSVKHLSGEVSGGSSSGIQEAKAAADANLPSA